MTPKEKAKELVLGFLIVPDSALKEDSNAAWIDRILAKQCANIAADEIIKSWQEDGNRRLDVGIVNWWQQVKTEIEKI